MLFPNNNTRWYLWCFTRNIYKFTQYTLKFNKETNKLSNFEVLRGRLILVTKQTIYNKTLLPIYVTYLSLHMQVDGHS